MNSWNFYPPPMKLYILITIVITSCLLASCSLTEGSTEGPRVSQEAISEAIKQADEVFGGAKDVEGLRGAVLLLGNVRDPESRNFEVEWRFAMMSFFLGQRLGTEAEKTPVYERGRDAGLIASRVNPDRPEGHFWYGANLGELAKLSPITVGIRSVNDIRQAMERVIELKPDYQGASAFEALAQVEMRTRTIGGGSAERAVELLEKALEYETENVRILVNLAEAYLAVRKDAQAREQLDRVLKMEPHPDYLHEHQEAVEKARELLRRNF
jgi:tetratricopeptide (TPR) repeat protein